MTPSRRGKAASGVLLAVLAALSLPALAQDEASEVQAGHVDPDVIQVDGRLDEAAWQQAGVIQDITQQSPHPGAPTPYHTKVLLLRDDHTLYIGLRCDDPDISKAVSHTLVRDGWQGNDDNVMFVLDTFGTKRFAYVFRVNSAGAMADGLLSPTPAINSNDGVDYNWDGIWSATVVQDEHGWTAEIAIDTRSLQFTDGLTRWGFNLARNVPRDLLTLDWTGVTLDSSVYQLQREGTLTGMQGMVQGKGFDFQPYGLVKYQSHPDANGKTVVDHTSKAGFDLKYNFNPSLAGLLTYHTDFAEADADQQQINTTRFALFFPEKRQFFLQGSNLLSFGYNLGTTFIPFNSRSIGLLNAQQVPLDEGVKLIGQSDSGSIALLDTQMAGNNVVLEPADPANHKPAILNDSTNLFVGRGTYNLNSQLQLGTIVTNGDPTGLSSNSFVGTDATWKTSTFQGDKNLNFAGWLGHSSGDLPTGNANGFGLDAEYPNDLWFAHVQYSQFGEALDPALGFVPRPGTRHYMNELSYQPRPDKDSWFNWVHRFWFYGHYSEDDSFGPPEYLPPSTPGGQPQLLAKQGKQSSEWFFSPQMLTEGGWYWEADVYQTYDAPTFPFPVVPGVNIPAGEYTYNRRRVVFNSPTSKSLWWELIDSQGTFYAGTAQHPLVQVNWNTPSGQLVLSATQEWLFYYQPAYLNPGQPDHGVTRLSTLTGTYSFTPTLYLSSQMQYQNGIPGVSYNMRLRWIVEGASNIYLVLNHGVVTETDGRGQPVIASGNAVILKVQWDFRN